MSRVRDTVESYLRGAKDTTTKTDTEVFTQYNISKSKLYYTPSTGQLNATKVIGAVYNDIADFIDVPECFEFSYGKTYIRQVDYRIAESSSYMQKGILGIASDTYGFAVGERKGINKEEKKFFCEDCGVYHTEICEVTKEESDSLRFLNSRIKTKPRRTRAPKKER